VIVQTPPPTIVTVDPETVQTVVVVLAYVTARPELAVAFNATAAAPYVTLLSVPNVMVCIRPTPVGSVAIALAEPPPDTVTWLLSCDAAFPATFTVTVIG